VIGSVIGDLVAVGEISAAHALSGMVRVRAYQPPAPSLHAGVTVVLEQHGVRREMGVVSATPHGRAAVLVAFPDVTDRTSAETLVGARILVRTADLPPVRDGEFYYHELVGFRVETMAGRQLGEIVETFSTGTNDVWTVRGPGGEHLIPVIADVVRDIDRSARRVVIEPLAGLLD
jgi:16S rRNA processing protein RimM